MSFDDILEKLNKKTRDRIVAASKITIEKIPVASVGLTRDLQGGLGKGRQTLLYGNKSAGKSSHMLQTIAAAQQRGQVCAWVDAEKSFDPEWASSLGVDNTKLLFSNAMSINDFTTDVCDFLEAKVDLVVVDSISALVPSTFFEKGNDFKEGLEGTKQIGTKSKELGIAINKFNFINSDTALVLISQMRNQFNMYGASLKPDGGQAMMFYSSTVIKLWSSASEKEQKTQEILMGDKLISTPVGRPVSYTVEYNKIGPPNRIGSYDFYYAGDTRGVDYVAEVTDLAIKSGLVIKGGAWIKYKGENIQGRDKFIIWLKENPLELKELEVRLLEQI